MNPYVVNFTINIYFPSYSGCIKIMIKVVEHMDVFLDIPIFK